jgi:hypothetical protein
MAIKIKVTCESVLFVITKYDWLFGYGTVELVEARCSFGGIASVFSVERIQSKQRVRNKLEVEVNVCSSHTLLDRYLFTRLHGTTSQKIIVLFTAIRTSDIIFLFPSLSFFF